MDSLCDLGLSSYEDRAYRGLLAIGSGTAAEISAESEVPKGRIYDALGGLESRGIVRVHTAREPKRYVPVEPDIAVTKLVTARQSELQNRMEQLDANKSTLVEQLADPTRPQEDFWTAAVGAEDSLELLFERIETAEESIVIAADSISAQFDVDREGPALLDQLLGAIDRGVEVKVLLSPRMFSDALGAVDDERAAFTLAQAPFELRTTEDMYGTFHLIDNTEVCLEVPDPLLANHLFGMLNLRDRSFAGRVAEGFRTTWDNATPIGDLSGPK
ncbi:TrmB family transcriptional regulator [Natronocalculus amylovorans]|uniref:TrmB family transcriptional regulator n=1 Tax=Natronocalculus amylovorans TaxID=2917812 RepID=A0AAE3G0B6_9EURY|nr:helix-turn-helix domain-containing protein [Natronocalculus amylovorans]MCL9818150.1 TrmB family transcriptional regulator [Natronocalculus amylovorans]